MNDEVIEILDELEDNTLRIAPIKNVNIGLRKEPEVVNENIPKAEPAPVVEIKEPEEADTNKVESLTPKNLESVEYSPIEPEKEDVKIEVTETEEETKSGLGFIIVLFVLLAAFIIALPYISKLF